MKQIGARFDVYKPSNGIRNGEMNLQLCLTTINMKNILNFFGFVCHLSYFSFLCVFYISVECRLFLCILLFLWSQTSLRLFQGI